MADYLNLKLKSRGSSSSQWLRAARDAGKPVGMAQKNNPAPFSIREYRPSDRPAVESLFRDGILEHVYPAFFRAMGHPDHVGVALSVATAGYVLGGSSYLQGLLFLCAWAGLIYYCCHDVYQGYLLRRLAADMADVPAGYLENPDNGFWVAEVAASAGGEPAVVGMAAVAGKRGEEEAERFDDWNGGVIGEDGSLGELCHLVVAFPWRRRGLGAELTRTAAEFCKQRGLARLALDVSSPQTAAVALCRKCGFVQTAAHGNTHANRWFARLARITVMRMEKNV